MRKLIRLIPRPVRSSSLLVLALILLAAGACSKTKEADEAKQKLAEAGDKAAEAAASATEAVKKQAAEVATATETKVSEATEEVNKQAAAATAQAKEEAAKLVAKAKETQHSVVAATEAKTEAISAEVAASRDKLVRDAQHRMGAIDAGITTLQGKLATAQGNVKKELADQIAVLQTRRAAVREQMIALGKASGAAWDDLAAGIEAAQHDMAKAIDEALAHFSK